VIREDHPDLNIFDLTFPGNDGLSAIPAIRKLSPKSEIVVFPMLSGPKMARLGLEAGARVFVSKLASPKQLVLAVRNAQSRKSFISSYPLRSFALFKAGEKRGQLRKSVQPKPKLSNREMEITKFLGRVSQTSKSR
jgi:DNA-binding NarL/FixJ family response regulator